MRRLTSTVTFRQGPHSAEALEGALRLAAPFSYGQDATHVLFNSPFLRLPDFASVLGSPRIDPHDDPTPPVFSGYITVPPVSSRHAIVSTFLSLLASLFSSTTTSTWCKSPPSSTLIFVMTKRPRLKQGATNVNTFHMFSSALRRLAPSPLETVSLIFPLPFPLPKLFHLRPLLHLQLCPPLVPLLLLLLLLSPRKPPLDALSIFLLSSLVRTPKGLDYLVRALPQAAILDICPNSLTPADPSGLPLPLRNVPHMDLIRYPLTKARVLTKVNPKAKTSLPLIGLTLVRAPPKDSLKPHRKDRKKALTQVSLGANGAPSHRVCSTSQSLASWPSLVLLLSPLYFLLPAWAYCPARGIPSRLVLILLSSRLSLSSSSYLLLLSLSQTPFSYRGQPGHIVRIVPPLLITMYPPLFDTSSSFFLLPPSSYLSCFWCWPKEASPKVAAP